MDLFYKRSIRVSLLLLTQSFIVALSDNVTQEQQTVAKVLTSFLKVPWMNENSFRADAVTTICQDDIATVFESAEAGEMWALRMLDATSKLPAGILTGNIYDLGMFDECIQVKSHDNPANIQGQHCMVSLSMPTKFFEDTSKIMYEQKLNLFNPSDHVNLSLSMSACVPSSCGIRDITGLVNTSIQNIPELNVFEVSVARVSCSSLESSNQLTLGMILTLSFFALVIFLLLFCTVCDLMFRTKFYDSSTVLENAAKFSLYRNAMNLFNTTSKSGSIPIICGIRFLSSCLIVCVHRLFSLLVMPTRNLSDLSELLHSMPTAILLTLSLIVETFFLLSGFFATISFLKSVRSGKKVNVFEIYLTRYVRLTPNIAVVLLFVTFILPYFGSGPVWDQVSAASISYCQKNWWTNVLYVQNMVNADEMCIPHTWYLAVEMQLYWLSPIILYPLFHRPKLGLVLLGFFLTASFFAPAIHLGVNRYSAISATHKRNMEMVSDFRESYGSTYNRALPFFLGILLGYVVSCNKRHISKTQAAFNWMLASLSIIFCVWTAYHIQPAVIVYDVAWEMIYVSVARLLWSATMAWVIYACTQGYGGPVTKFLSLPIFQPLSRMTYSIYLVHFVLQIATAATERNTLYMAPYNVVCQILSDIVLSIVIALLLCLFIEFPAITLGKMLISKRNLVTKQPRCSIEVEEYLNRTGDQISSGVVIESITSRLDFWELISDDLNTLSEEPVKTPAQWSQAWKNWQVKLIEMDGILKAYERSKSVEVEGFEPLAAVVSLRKELLVFLAAVNYGATVNVNSGEAENRRHIDRIQLPSSDEILLDGKKIN